MATSSLADFSPVYVALGMLAATAVAYKLTSPLPAHERFAKANGLKHIKLPKRLPRTHAVLGDVVELSQNAHRFFEWMLEKTIECGDAPWVRHVPGLNDMVMISTPELAEDVMKTQVDNFGKGPLTRELFFDLVGDAFFSQDGLEWFHQRKTASKFFTARMFRDVATKMINSHAEEVFHVLEKSQETHEFVDLTKLIHEFTLQTFAELGFGLQMQLIGQPASHPLDKALGDAFPQVLRRLQLPPWVWKMQKYLNLGGEKEYKQTTQYIRSLVSEMVSKSLAQSSEKEREEAATIVELFIHAMRDGDGQYSPELLCDIAIMFIVGGRDTSADALNWFLLLLSKNQHVEQKIRQELWDQVPELMEGKISCLEMEQTQLLTYMEAAIKETLRLYPAVPLYVRQAENDAVLVDGTFIAKGTAVAMCPFTLGRLPSVWGEDAAEFKPERFIDHDTGKLKILSPYKFFSFGAGPRVCIGMNLGMLEMKLVLAALLSRFRLEVAPNDGTIKFSATLPLQNPLMVRVHSARAASA